MRAYRSSELPGCDYLTMASGSAIVSVKEKATSDAPNLGSIDMDNASHGETELVNSVLNC